jgi:multidrug efflux system membrane fusion protein
VNFDEGQDVKKGDVLAQIDPTTYKASLDQAVAKKAQDEAQLANSRNDLARYQRLAATNAINQQQADTQKALVAQNEALVQADQAAIDNARAMLSYTTIVAPIDGRTGIRQVDAGNIIHASDTNGVVIITQITPISVLFNLPQQNLDQVNAAFAKGALPVDALRSDDDKVIANGKLTVVDNQVDQSTGTVKLKAEFPNADRQLWPGQFVNVRLLADTLKQVVVVPTGAVQRGPKGTFVYVVKDDDTVSVQSITVQRQDEDQAVVSKGIEPDQRVVTTGFVRLAEGTKVAATAPGEQPATPAPTERRRRNRAPGQSSGGR